MRKWNYGLLAILVFGLLACNGDGRRSPPSTGKAENNPYLILAEQELSPPTLPKNRSSPTPPPKTKTAVNTGIRLPKVNPLEVEGDLTIAGSYTVFPLTKRIFHRFVEEGYAGILKLDSISSDEGFKLFCQDGKIDIANASRPINFEEIDACNAKGRSPLQFPVGSDAIVVVVHPENNFLNNVSFYELDLIFTARNWSDVNPSWPNQPIQRFVGHRDSEIVEFFAAIVFNSNLQPIFNAPNTKFTEIDIELIRRVSSNKYAVGFLSYANYRQNAESLKMLSIEGVKADFNAIENEQYFLVRPLFIYTDAKMMKNNPQVADFINFYLTNASEEAWQIGYFPASKRELEEAKLKFLEETR
ncbi:MAG: substrate-binding domain-containing protein [Cyanobacteriota bacterium]|nr:substrate-binding domain-containing protein [Cyanobacteriota bacterium]